MFNLKEKNDKLAIVIVHFGTTYDKTRVKTIDKINEKIMGKYKNITVREAYTSRIIIRKLKERGIEKLHPIQVFEELKNEGYTHILVQATHIINGIESENLKNELKEYEKYFKEVRIGEPLLTLPNDYIKVANILIDNFSNYGEKTGIVFVGHGTEHFSCATYPMMDYIFSSLGHKNFVVGAIEGFPEIEYIIKKLKEGNFKDVVLTPFMFVSGEHANNDIAVDWKEKLEENGFIVKNVILKGLGEYEKIQDLFIEHLNHAAENTEENIAEKKVKYLAGK